MALPTHRPAHRTAAALLAALLTSVTAQAQPAAPADNCEGIRQQIEGRFRAGGLPGVVLLVVPAGSGGGRVVGSCANGSRQIVHTGTAGGATAQRPAERASDRPADKTPEQPAERSADRIPTECKDGSVVIGPNCDDPRAVRMTPAEIAGSMAAAQPAKAASAASQ